MEIYNHPKYYEIAFSYRDIAGEVNFIEQAIGDYARVPVHTVLELASGNSPHMAELSKRGYRYVGIESGDQMLAYSRTRIREQDLNAEIVKGDMTGFRLAEPVDCALLFLGSLYVKDDAELARHLRSVAGALRPGGLYFLDGVVTPTGEGREAQEWRISRDGITVGARWAPRWLDEKEGLAQETITLDIDDDGRRKTLRHTEVKKRYTADDFVARAERAGEWKQVQTCSDFDLKKSIEAGGRSMLILRRR